MAFHTTTIDLTTTPVQVFGAATTWANNSLASVGDPVSFSLYNSGPVIRIGGTSSTAQTGFPIASSGIFATDFKVAESLWAFTSASTGNVIVIAGRQ